MVKKYDRRLRASFPLYYKPVFSGFDIETTNINDDDFKRAYMYHAQMSVFTWERGVVYTARTWEEVGALFEALKEFYQTDKETRIVSWIANASFEHQFMARRFEWSEDPWDFFAKEKRQPLLFTLKGGIEFRECLSISGGGLAQLCKDFTYTKKKKGDLDFKIARNSTTELSEKELGYCVNDVVPLAEWSAYIFEQFVKDDPAGGIPLTKTGILRHEVKAAAKKYLRGRHASDWKQLLASAHPHKNRYKTWRHFLFRGGYVHANVGFVGRILGDKEDELVDMYDITSSYPARMNLSKMPGKFILLHPDYYTEEYLDKLAASPDYSFYCKALFTNLRARFTHSIESLSKAVHISDFALDNGRIRSAGTLSVYLTDYDWRIYKMFYEWDSVEFETVNYSKNMWLPPYVLEPLNNHYRAKAKMKKAGLSKTPEYAIEKSGVNAFFGLTVTALTETTWIFTNADGWQEVENDLDFSDEANKAVLLPQWGIWICAAARFSLLSVVWAIESTLGTDPAFKKKHPYGAVIYNDTDSIKCVHDERIKTIIDKYNKSIQAQLKSRGLTDSEFDDLGCYDFEGTAVRFSTLGAKRYICKVWDKDENDYVTTATVAGLPKCVCAEMQKDGKDPFEEFKAEGMLIDKDKSNKRTHAWVDYAHSDYVNGELMTELSSVAIYEIPFNLKLDDDYYKLVGAYLLEGENKL